MESHASGDLQSPGTDESRSKLAYSPRYRHSQESAGTASDAEELAYNSRYASVYHGEPAGASAAAEGQWLNMAGLTEVSHATPEGTPQGNGSPRAAASAIIRHRSGSDDDSDNEPISRIAEYTRSASLSTRSAAAAAAALAARTTAMSERISSGLSGQSVEAAVRVLEQEGGGVDPLSGVGALNGPTDAGSTSTAGSVATHLEAATHEGASEGDRVEHVALQPPQDGRQEAAADDEPVAFEQAEAVAANEPDLHLGTHATVPAGSSPAAVQCDGADEPTDSTRATTSLSQDQSSVEPGPVAPAPAPGTDGLDGAPEAFSDAAAGLAAGSMIDCRCDAPADVFEAATAVAQETTEWQAPETAGSSVGGVYAYDAALGHDGTVTGAYGEHCFEAQPAGAEQEPGHEVAPSDVADCNAPTAAQTGTDGPAYVSEEPIIAAEYQQGAPEAAGVADPGAYHAEAQGAGAQPEEVQAAAAAAAHAAEAGAAYRAGSGPVGDLAGPSGVLEQHGSSTLLDEYRVAAAAGLVSPEVASLLGLAPPIATAGGSGEVLPVEAEKPAAEDDEEEVEEDGEEAPSAAADQVSSDAALGTLQSETFSQEAVLTAESSDVVLDLIAGGACSGDTAAAATADPPAAASASAALLQDAASVANASARSAAAGKARGRDPFYAGDTDEDDSFVMESLNSAPQTPGAQQRQQPLDDQEDAVPHMAAAPLAPPGSGAVQAGSAVGGDARGASVGVAVAAAGVGLMAAAAGAAAVAHRATGAADQPAPQPHLQAQRGLAPPAVPGDAPSPYAMSGAFAQPPIQPSGQQPQQQPGSLALPRGPAMSPPGPPLPMSMRPSASPGTPPGPAPMQHQPPQPQLLRMSPAASPRAGPGPAPGAPGIHPQPGSPLLRMPGGPGMGPGAGAPGFLPNGQGQVRPMGPPQAPMQHPGQLPPGAVPPGARPPGPPAPGMAPRPGMVPQGPGSGPRPPLPAGMQVPGPGGPGAGQWRPQGPPGGPMPRGPGAPGGPPMPARQMGAVRPPMMAGGPRPPLPPSATPPPPSPYPGLLYTEGRDTLGRPVVVLNTAMLPAKAKKNDVLQYVLQQLQPVVQQEYVLVVLSLAMGVKASSVSSTWALGAYRSLAKPYRKNVKHIVLVQPSAWARALLALAQPFVSKKAAHKIKKVDNLVQVAEATNGEVKLDSLGARFIREIQYGLGASPLAGLVPPNGGPRPAGPPGPQPPGPGMRPPGPPVNGAPQRMPMPGPGGPPRPVMPPGQQLVRPNGPGAANGPLAQPLLSAHSPRGPPPQAGPRPPTASNVTTPVYGPGGPGPATARPDGPPQLRMQLFPPGPGAPPEGFGPNGAVGGPRPLGPPPTGAAGGFVTPPPMGRPGGPQRAPGQ